MTPHSKCDKMTKELLVLGLYFVSFLRCYIVKQNWIGLLWHKINLQSNSQSRLDDYLKRLSPLSPPPPRWFPACCRPCRPTPSEGHAGEVRTRLGGGVCRKYDGKRRGSEEQHRSPAGLLHPTGEQSGLLPLRTPSWTAVIYSYKPSWQLSSHSPTNHPSTCTQRPENLPRGAHSSPAATPAAPTGTTRHG